MDSAVAQARELHRKVQQFTGLSRDYKVRRDELIRRLYRTGDYSYGSLARQIGCSPELVAAVVKGVR